MLQDDPFAGIEAESPGLTITEAESLLRAHYGVRATLTPLLSERDQNFLVAGADGTRAVLKIASAAEDPLVTRFQIDALEHIEATDPSIPVPRIKRTLGGRRCFELTHNGAAHIVRVVSWLPGEPFGSGRVSAGLAEHIGQLMGRLDRALGGFAHPGDAQPLLWDMRRAPQLERLLPHIRDEATRRLVATTLERFASDALPRFAQLPTQVIHNDANPGNLLVDQTRERALGIIDFGDMVRLPRVVEVAVAGSYLRSDTTDPLALVLPLVRGFCAVTGLGREELALLPLLIETRLATTIAILEWRRELRGADDDYLEDASETEASARPFLENLRAIPREEGVAALAAAAGV